MHIALLSLPENFHCQKWARMLQAAGAQVSVYSLSAATLPDVRTVQLPKALGGGKGYSYLDYALTASRLAEQLHADRVDVVHALHLTPFGSWGHWSGFRPLIAGALGADVLSYTPDAPQHVYGETQEPLPFVRHAKRLWYGRQVRKVVEGADLLTADNAVLRTALIAHMGANPQRVRLLPWGVAPEILAPKASVVAMMRARLQLLPEQRVILSPRGLTDFYQADTILSAIQQIVADGDTCIAHTHKFVVLTAGYAAKPSLLHCAQRLALQYPQRFVLIDEQLSAEQMGGLWACTDVFVSAPLFDGYAATVAEGRAAGAIPLVNDIPGYRELLTADVHALYVQPFVAEELARRLTDVASQITYHRGSIGAANLRWAAAHADGRQSTQSFLSWCEELLEKWR